MADNSWMPVVEREPSEQTYPRVPREAGSEGTLVGFLDYLAGIPTRAQNLGDISRGIYGPSAAEKLQNDQFARQDASNAASATIAERIATLRAENPSLPPAMLQQKVLTDKLVLQNMMKVDAGKMPDLVSGIQNSLFPAPVKGVPLSEGAQLVNPESGAPLGAKNPKTFDPDRSFNTHASGALVKRHAAFLTDSDAAEQQMGNLRQLREALTNAPEAGIMTTLRSMATQKFGIDVKDKKDIDILNSLADRVAPSLRVPGSGAQSDIEFKAFKNSLPSLMQSRAGREIIQDNLEALAQKRIAAGEIAGRRLRGAISEEQADAEYKKLYGAKAKRQRWNATTGTLETVE